MPEIAVKKAIEALECGDVIVAFVHPDGHVLTVRGGPLEVAAVEATGGQWDGVPQFKISTTSRTRAARYANGATHVVVVA